MTPTCLDCGKGISTRSRSGRCNACFNISKGKDPIFQAARAEGIRRKFKDPEHLAKMQRIARRNGQKARCDPAYAKQLSERGKILAETVLKSPEVRARTMSKASRALAGRAIHEFHMGWCPVEYRDHYRRLVRSKRMPAADARQATLRKIELDTLAPIARLHADAAADFLRRYTAVQRTEEGWRYGTTVLTPEQLIERAQLKGWQPSRWAA